MLNTDLEQIDLQQELSRIPAEYQDIFRQKLSEEVDELGPEADDTAVLHYLRRRREEMRRGGYIRPDGRPGLVEVDPETLYERGLRAGRPASTDRRRTLLKVAGLCLLGVLALFFLLRGRAIRAGDPQPSVTPDAESAAATGTPSIPDVSSSDEVLRTIGGLGGALTIGRPSALELHYAATEETIALPIDPSRITTRGELRYDELTMLSAQPVAVWIFGAVVNYAVGVPEGLVRNLQAGDRLILNTDTGAMLPFRVSETLQAAAHEATALLSQNRAGMTLFSLPAPASDAVTIALAAYDTAAETRPQLPVYALGETFSLTGRGEMRVDEILYEQRANKSLAVLVYGSYTAGSQATAETPAVTLSLSGAGLQTPALHLQVTEEGGWQAEFELPQTAAGSPFFAELRPLTGGETVLVRLGEVPDLPAQLQVTVGPAFVDARTVSAVLQVTVHNPAGGAVYLFEGDIEIRHSEGGDAYTLSRQVTPSLPLLIQPGETVGLTVTLWGFLPVENQPVTSVEVRIGADLWQLSGPFVNALTGR
jgi:hypothetical protein